MVHTVHDAISISTEVIRALRNKGKNEEKPLPKFRHREHRVSRITVQKKCLSKNGEIPLSNKKNKNSHKRNNELRNFVNKSFGSIFNLTA